jgi:hypothetical protein
MAGVIPNLGIPCHGIPHPITFERRNNVGLYVKYALFLSSFDQDQNVLADFSKTPYYQIS